MSSELCSSFAWNCLIGQVNDPLPLFVIQLAAQLQVNVSKECGPSGSQDQSRPVLPSPFSLTRSEEQPPIWKHICHENTSDALQRVGLLSRSNCCKPHAETLMPLPMSHSACNHTECMSGSVDAMWFVFPAWLLTRRNLWHFVDSTKSFLSLWSVFAEVERTDTRHRNVYGNRKCTGADCSWEQTVVCVKQWHIIDWKLCVVVQNTRVWSSCGMNPHLTQLKKKLPCFSCHWTFISRCSVEFLVCAHAVTTGPCPQRCVISSHLSYKRCRMFDWNKFGPLWKGILGSGAQDLLSSIFGVESSWQSCCGWSHSFLSQRVFVSVKKIAWLQLQKCGMNGNNFSARVSDGHSWWSAETHAHGGCLAVDWIWFHQPPKFDSRYRERDVQLLIFGTSVIIYKANVRQAWSPK